MWHMDVNHMYSMTCPLKLCLYYHSLAAPQSCPKFEVLSYTPYAHGSIAVTSYENAIIVPSVFEKQSTFHTHRGGLLAQLICIL